MKGTFFRVASKKKENTKYADYYIVYKSVHLTSLLQGLQGSKECTVCSFYSTIYITIARRPTRPWKTASFLGISLLSAARRSTTYSFLPRNGSEEHLVIRTLTDHVFFTLRLLRTTLCEDVKLYCVVCASVCTKCLYVNPCLLAYACTCVRACIREVACIR